MDANVNLSPANRTVLEQKPNARKTEQPEAAKSVEMKPDGDKKLAYALGALGILGVVTAAGVAIYKHKNPTKALADIKFDKGIASLKEGGDKFTGKITDTLKNGDKITMKYKDGVLQSSTRKGKVSFEKVYETLENGNHKVTVKKDGKTTETVLETVKEAVKKSQDDFKALVGKKDSLSAAEFEKQAKAIQYKSVNQQKELDAILAYKKTPVAKLEAVKFDKGVATLKEGGAKFSGRIEDTINGGDKIVMEYKDGVLTKSTRTTKEGKTAFEKTYETLSDGTHKVSTTKDGKTANVILEDVQAAVKKSQDTYHELDRMVSMKPEEFDAKVADLKYLNADQKAMVANWQSYVHPKEISEISFDKGVATLKETGEKYTGYVTHTNAKTGDNYMLMYQDGNLTFSSRVLEDGSPDFAKFYETRGGDKIVRTMDFNGGGAAPDESIANITQMNAQVKAQQEELTTILEKANDTSVSAEDFKKQADTIQYKSANQKKEIDRVVSQKERLAEQAKIMQLRAKTVTDNGSFAQRLNFLETTNQIETYISDGPVAEIEEAFKKLKPETIDALSDDFIAKTVRNGVMKDTIASKLATLEQDFTPEQLKKLTGSTYYNVGMMQYMTDSNMLPAQMLTYVLS